MEHARIGFDQPPPDHLDAARLADARLIVAVHVRTHGELALFLFGIEQRANIDRVAQRIAGTLRRAGDWAGFHARAFHAHEHLGRRADKLLFAELQEELVRARARAL